MAAIATPAPSAPEQYRPDRKSRSDLRPVKLLAKYELERDRLRLARICAATWGVNRPLKQKAGA
jgi:hypothetical protein